MRRILAIVFVMLWGRGEGADILIVHALATKSHVNFVRPLAEALGGKGHRVTLATPYDLRSARNVEALKIPGLDVMFEDAGKVVWVQGGAAGWLGLVKRFGHINDFSSVVCNASLNFPPLRKYLEGRKKVDLVMTSVFFEDCLLSIPYRNNVPFVYMSPGGYMPHQVYLQGHFENPSFVPIVMTPYTDRMNFWERLNNFLLYYGIMGYIRYFVFPVQHRLVKKLVGDDIPDLEDLARNASLYLINREFSVQHPRPQLPVSIDVGGLHAEPAKPLPKVKFVSGPFDLLRIFLELMCFLLYREPSLFIMQRVK